MYIYMCMYVCMWAYLCFIIVCVNRNNKLKKCRECSKPVNAIPLSNNIFISFWQQKQKCINKLTLCGYVWTYIHTYVRMYVRVALWCALAISDERWHETNTRSNKVLCALLIFLDCFDFWNAQNVVFRSIINDKLLMWHLN